MSRRKFVAGAGASCAALAASGSASAATETSTPTGEWQSGRDGLNFDSGLVQNPYFAEGTLTRAKHKLTWGVDDEALRAFEDDSGEKSMLSGHVDREDTENVLTLRADKFEFPDAYAFPQGETYDGDGDGDADEDVSALDATHWSKSSGTNSSLTVSDGDLDVKKSLTVDASVASGEVARATFSDVSIGDSVSKIFSQGVVNITTLATGATVEVAVIDDDGDEKVMKAVEAGDTSKTGVFAASAGDGYVYQQRLGDLSTVANGDGSFDSIESVEIRVLEANATVTFTALNAEKKDKWLFGSYLANEGTDSEERVKRYRPSGTFTVTGLDTLGDATSADDAIIFDVDQPMKYTMRLADGDFEYRIIGPGDYNANYEHRLQMRGKQQVETGYDLTHTALTYSDKVSAPASRYTNVETASGIGQTDFEDVDDSSKTGHGGSYSNKGDTVELVASASAGTTYGFWSTTLLASDAEKDEVEADSDGGGGGGGAPPASTNKTPWAVIMGIVTSILAGLGMKMRG